MPRHTLSPTHITTAHPLLSACPPMRSPRHSVPAGRRCAHTARATPENARVPRPPERAGRGRARSACQTSSHWVSGRRGVPFGERKGEVQRGYLLNLRVKVPPAQIPVWRRSYIRQPTGATLTVESPEVNDSGEGVSPTDQPRRLTTRRAVARANGLIVEIPPSVELVAGSRSAKGFPLLPDGQC